MSKDTLKEYGPDAHKPQAARATCGGVTEAKELPYTKPVGPTNQYHRGPGLGGTNHGNSQQHK
jgi:hypothetical protein